jgi:hypothetical protein
MENGADKWQKERIGTADVLYLSTRCFLLELLKSTKINKGQSLCLLLLSSFSSKVEGVRARIVWIVAVSFQRAGIGNVVPLKNCQSFCVFYLF